MPQFRWLVTGFLLEMPGFSFRVGGTNCSNSVTLVYLHKCVINKLYAAGDAGIS